MEFAPNALPVIFWQFRQWHKVVATGSPVTVYKTDLHRQDPLQVCGSEEGFGSMLEPCFD